MKTDLEELSDSVLEDLSSSDSESTNKKYLMDANKFSISMNNEEYSMNN